MSEVPLYMHRAVGQRRPSRSLKSLSDSDCARPAPLSTLLPSRPRNPPAPPNAPTPDPGDDGFCLSKRVGTPPRPPQLGSASLLSADGVERGEAGAT